MNNTIGNPSNFAISYCFYEDSHETEIEMIVNNINLLEFERNGCHLTTKWNLDDLVIWLRTFLNNLSEDPYPVDNEGLFAAEKDLLARDFDTDDDAIFDAYYDCIDAWTEKHCWHSASSGGILSDLFFQQIGNKIEISWNNSYQPVGVSFKSNIGFVTVEKDIFIKVIDSFLKKYAQHWFK